MAVLSAESGGSVQLSEFTVAPVDYTPDMTNDDRNRLVAETVVGMMNERRVKSKTIALSLSGQSVFTRFVRLPAVDESKVAQIIKYEAQQQVPFPIDEVEWDYQIIGTGAEEEIDVVLVAMKKELLMGLINALKKVGIEVSAITVSPIALYNCTIFNEELYSGATALIDFGAKTTSLIICDGDSLWSRNIPIGGENVTQAVAKELNIAPEEAEKLKRESYVEAGGSVPSGADEGQVRAAKTITGVFQRIISEVRRSIGFYRAQSKGSAITRVLISGGGIMLGNLREYLEGSLKVPVEPLFPIRKLSVSDSVDRGELNAQRHVLGDVIGLGLRMLEKVRLSVNLIPKIIAYQKELAKKKVFFAGAAVCLMATLVGIIVNTKNMRKSFDLELQGLNIKIGRLEPKKAALLKIKSERDSYEKKIKKVAKIQEKALYWVNFIETIKKKERSALEGKNLTAWFTKIEVGGLSRASSGFSSTGGYSPYTMGGSSMPSGMGPTSPYGPPGGTSPYGRRSDDTGPRVAKGTVELTGYLKLGNITGETDHVKVAATKIEEFKRVLQSDDTRDTFRYSWNHFDEKLPEVRNEKLKAIANAMRQLRKKLDKQANSYLDKNKRIIPMEFIPENSLDMRLEEILGELIRENVERVTNPVRGGLVLSEQEKFDKQARGLIPLMKAREGGSELSAKQLEKYRRIINSLATRIRPKGAPVPAPGEEAAKYDKLVEDLKSLAAGGADGSDGGLGADDRKDYEAKVDALILLIKKQNEDYEALAALVKGVSTGPGVNNMAGVNPGGAEDKDYDALARAMVQLTEDQERYNKLTGPLVELLKGPRVGLKLQDRKEFDALTEYNAAFEEMLAQFNETAGSDLFGDITVEEQGTLIYDPRIAKFVFKAKLNIAIEF